MQYIRYCKRRNNKTKQAMERVCSKCGEVKSANGFYKSRSDCIECFKAYRRQRYMITKNYYNTVDGWVNQILANKRIYCKRKDLPYDLTKTWLREKLRLGRCEVTEIGFELHKGKRSPFGPSIDRIDPRRGYTRDNCRVVVNCYNQAKSDWSDNDVLRMAKALMSKREGG